MKHCYLFLVALLFVSTGYGQENILLEEYMPKSIYKIPETKVEKAKRLKTDNSVSYTKIKFVIILIVIRRRFPPFYIYRTIVLPQNRSP